MAAVKAQVLLCLLSGLMLGGCAAVQTTREGPGAADAPRNGLSYFLPKGHVVVQLTWNPQLGSWNVTPTVLIEADPSERFDLDWSNSILSDKDTTVSVDPATGLLETLDASTPGQNVNTVGALVGAEPNVLRLGTTTAPESSYSGQGFTAEDYLAYAQKSPAEAQSAASYPASAQLILSDDAPTEATVLLAAPGHGSGHLYAAIRARLTRRYDLGADFPRNRKWALPPDGKGGGIVVRLPIPYELSVEETLSPDATFRDSAQRRVCAIAPRIVMLPDSQHDFLYRVLGRPLVTDTTRIALTNGMIQSLEQVRPSLLAALIALPKYLVLNVVPVPVEVTQSQQTISNAQSRLAAGQSADATATTDR